MDGFRGWTQEKQVAINKRLTVFDRAPFTDELAKALAASPDPDAIYQFANKYPDRWAQMIAILARVAGFTEKSEVINTHVIKVQEMSDAELDQLLGSKLLELQAVQVKESEESAPPLLESARLPPSTHEDAKPYSSEGISSNSISTTPSSSR